MFVPVALVNVSPARLVIPDTFKLVEETLVKKAVVPEKFVLVIEVPTAFVKLRPGKFPLVEVTFVNTARVPEKFVLVILVPTAME